MSRTPPNSKQSLTRLRKVSTYLKSMRGFIALFVVPLAVVMLGAMIIDYCESSLSLKYEGLNDHSEHVFSILNSGKIDMTITNAALGLFDQVYMIKKDIGELDQDKVISKDRKKPTMYIHNGKLFIPDRDKLASGGTIKNLVGINIKPAEQKRFVVENIPTLLIADFCIVYDSRPSNTLFYPFYRLLQMVGIRNVTSVAYFTIENGRIIDLANPFNENGFIKRAVHGIKSVLDE